MGEDTQDLHQNAHAPQLNVPAQPIRTHQWAAAGALGAAECAPACEGPRGGRAAGKRSMADAARQLRHTLNGQRGARDARRGTARATVRVQLLEPALARRSAHPAHDELERVDQLACSGARWARRKPRRRWPLRRCSARLGCGCGICAAGGCRPAWQRIAQAGRAGAMVRLENHIPRRHFASAVTHRLRRCRALNPQKASGSARGRPTCAPLPYDTNRGVHPPCSIRRTQCSSFWRTEWMAY